MNSSKKKDFARINTLHFSFATICQNEYQLYLYFLKQRANLTNPDDIMAGIKIEDKCFAAGAKVIVFTAMTLESAIYDWAARRLGDKYVTEYINKLDIISKWIVVPKLINQKEIRKDKAPFACFKKTVCARNLLVHHKSEDWKCGDIPQIEKLRRKN